MKQLRQAILWAVLVAIVLLIVLSAIGAILGAEEAKALFNSWPMVIFWFLAAALLVAGFAAFRRLIAAPAGLAMHLGILLVLAGAMWGSVKGHEFREAWFGDRKVPHGYMPIMEGDAENRLFADDLQTPIGRLPFSLYLKDFSVEHYPPEQKTWALVVVAPGLDPDGNPVQHQQQVTWQVGEEAPVPFAGVRLKVLRYLERARPTFAPDARPRLLVLNPGGEPLADLPTQPDAEAALKDPPVTVRVVRVFANLKVMGSGPDRQVVDSPGRGQNPALQVRVSGTEGPLWEGYVLPQFPTPVRTEPGEPRLVLQYALPQPNGAAEDPASDVPAMLVELAYEGRTSTEWFLPREGEELARLSLAPLIHGRTPGHDERGALMAPSLYLLKPVGPVSDYKSDLEVREDDRTAARQVVEVNHPLHWGGYHFYQHSYDTQHEAYTILSAVSDSGLRVVYAGLALLALGAFGRFWTEPLWGYTRKKMLNVK